MQLQKQRNKIEIKIVTGDILSFPLWLFGKN